MFGGNPLAVVLDASGLTAAQMQAIAAEFNYSETTFVLPPRAAAHTAQVRIFTPRSEVPFAGHPNVGTAVVLARHLEAQGAAPREHFIFEEAAGLVPVRLLRAGATVVGAELTAPEPLSILATVSAGDAAPACRWPRATRYSARACSRRSTPAWRIRPPAARAQQPSHCLRRYSPNATLTRRGALNRGSTWAGRACCSGER